MSLCWVSWYVRRADQIILKCLCFLENGLLQSLWRKFGSRKYVFSGFSCHNSFNEPPSSLPILCNSIVYLYYSYFCCPALFCFWAFPISFGKIFPSHDFGEQWSVFNIHNNNILFSIHNPVKIGRASDVRISPQWCLVAKRTQKNIKMVLTPDPEHQTCKRRVAPVYYPGMIKQVRKYF